MDGTICALYGVEGWLDYLMASDATPYKVAKPLINMNVLARRLNKLQRNGWRLTIISWLAKNSTKEFDRAVINAKLGWLKKHLPSVKWDEINIVPYGTPKSNFGTSTSVLFDDEKPNRENWIGTAYDVDNILGVLRTL
jgi:hypothetical protein